MADKDFNGHIYRLGGDEFVLFYNEPAGSFPALDAARDHYKRLFKKAFLSYTLPNIDQSCTLSMGVAFFPQHGFSASELLRKADIALYRAKSEGRNRLIFFEDRYDSAKKFKDLYINIQPVLTSAGVTYGYELVDRGNEGKDDEDSLNLADFNRTLDALGLGDIENNTKYFISLTNQLLSPAVLNNLPKDKFVVQIYLKGLPTPEELEKYRQLRGSGYTLSVTGLTKDNALPAMMELAHFCKFQAGAVDTYHQRKMILEYPSKHFIAGDVNTPKALEEAKQSGFKLFQGFFFSQPALLKKTKDIDPLKVNYLRLIKLTSTEAYVDFREISSVIATDVAMSYKLLRLLNSAAVGLRNPVSSIDMAVAYLGEDSLKKWVALLALRGVASDQPLELIRLSLIRAQFGELLAAHLKPKRAPQSVFMVGLFSLLHIALEKSKEELFEEIPVSDEIKNSLLSADGPHSDLVTFFNNYEYANWDEVTRFAETNGLSDRFVSDAYIAAVTWYNDLTEE
jgi:EAL and modified HD-GYP domain-containing signal transduction protein